MHSFKEVNNWQYGFISAGHIIMNADYAHLNTGNSDFSNAGQILYTCSAIYANKQSLIQFWAWRYIRLI